MPKASILRLLILSYSIAVANCNSALTQIQPIGSIDALLDAARQKQIHLGIIYDDQKTLEKTSVAYSNGQSVESIVTQIPGYESVLEDGVTIVRPRSLPHVTEKMLGTVIEDFASGPATVSQ